MSNESILKEVSEVENCFIVDKKEWLKTIRTEFVQSPGHDAVEYITDKCNIAGYMNQPVATYNGKPLIALSRKVSDIDEFIDWFKFSEWFDNHSIFLYQILYQPSLPQYYSVDPNTFEQQKNEKLEMTEAYWIIRFAILEGTVANG